MVFDIEPFMRLMMLVWLPFGLPIGLFLGYWGAAAMAKADIEEFSQCLDEKTLGVPRKLFCPFLTLSGIAGFAAVLFILLASAQLGCFFRPLWSWPWWKLKEK